MSAKNFEFGFPTKEPVSYEEAVMYCFFYNQLDSKGWRLMTVDEYVDYIWQFGLFYRPVWTQTEYATENKWIAIPVREIHE